MPRPGQSLTSVGTRRALFPPPDVSLLAEGWEADYGCVTGPNSTWVGIKRGEVLVNTGGSKRPTIGVQSGDRFRGRPVMMYDGVDDYLSSAAGMSTPLFLANSRPYIAVVGSIEAEPVAQNDRVAYCAVSPSFQGNVNYLLCSHCMRPQGLTADAIWWIPVTTEGHAIRTEVATVPGGVEFFEAWVDSGNTLQVAVNGTVGIAYEIGSALLDENKNRVDSGCYATGAFLGKQSIAAHLYYSSTPNRANMLAWARAKYGTP